MPVMIFVDVCFSKKKVQNGSALFLFHVFDIHGELRIHEKNLPARHRVNADDRMGGFRIHILKLTQSLSALKNSGST